MCLMNAKENHLSSHKRVKINLLHGLKRKNSAIIFYEVLTSKYRIVSYISIFNKHTNNLEFTEFGKLENDRNRLCYRRERSCTIFPILLETLRDFNSEDESCRRYSASLRSFLS